jgi:hypothetical protein
LQSFRETLSIISGRRGTVAKLLAGWRPRRLLALGAAVALLVGTVQTPAFASNTLYGLHWQQNPGGGYPRWVPYHDHTNPTIYSDVFNHTFALWYYANNNWYPYQVCNTCSTKIDGVNAYYNDPSFIGAAEVSYSGSHITFVTIKLDDADLSGRTYNELHAVTCQEQGHAGGLDHVYSAGSTSCMRYGGYGWPPTDFNQHDTDTLFSLNQHID